MAKTVDKVLAVASAEVGYLEKKTNSNLYDKTANVGAKNYTKYAHELDTNHPDFYNGRKNGFDWCDVFVDWCFVTAFGVADALELLCQPKKSCGAGCEYSAVYFKVKNQFYKSPKAGDQIFFKNSSGSVVHTGLVYDADDQYVYTIEGNTSSASGVVANGGCVAKKKYALTNSRIYGYGRPKYDEATKPVETEKTITQLAREVLKGKWGNGSARKANLTAAGYDYNAVQKEVNRLCNSSKKSNETIAKEVLRGKWGNGTDRKNRLTKAGYDYNAIQAIVNKLL